MWPRTRGELLELVEVETQIWKVRLEDGSILRARAADLWPDAALRPLKVHVASDAEASEWNWAEKFSTDSAGRLVKVRRSPIHDWQIGLSSLDTSTSLIAWISEFVP